MPKNRMIREIQETPDVLQRLIDSEYERLERYAEWVKRQEFDSITFVARGTSDNACLYGRYLVETLLQIPCHLAAPSVVTIYNRAVIAPRTLVIGVSQSGESTDVVEYLARAKEKGSATMAITNTPSSKITNVADTTFFLHAGKEESVAATKTYTSTLMLLYIFISLLHGRKTLVESIPEMPGLVANSLEMEKTIEEHTVRYRFINQAVVLGRGYNFSTAKEAALKLMETCYLPAQAFSMADFMHGPIAMIHEGFPTILFVNGGKMSRPMLELAKNLASKHTESLIFSNTNETKRYANVHFLLSRGLPEEACPISYIVPVQLFCYYLSVLRGQDPDNPKYLSKITRTR